MSDPNRLRDPDWAWAPYTPSERRRWVLPLAGHLYRRAAFGATWDELQRALADGPQKTIDRLLRPDGLAVFNHEYDKYETAAASGDVNGLQAWWLRRMIHSPEPLTEKMILFWHGHFAVSADRVNNTPLMHAHVKLLRRHATGQFGKLLADVSRDPAFLMSLGAAAHRKAQPNEQFARHLLDQLTVGSGNYSTADVRSVARAFTGHFVLRFEHRFLEREHDADEKTVLGTKGAFGSDKAVHIIAQHPAAAKRVVRKLFRWFVSETDEPSDELLTPLAESFSADLHVGRLIEKILRSNLFFSQAAYRQRIKSPVEFAVGIVRSLEASVPTLSLGQRLATLGQELYRPPTVKGWVGGRHWINPATIIGRNNLAGEMLSGSGPLGGKLDPAALAKQHGVGAAESAEMFLFDLLLQGEVDEKQRLAIRKSLSSGGTLSSRLQQLGHAITSQPEFQLA